MKARLAPIRAATFKAAALQVVQQLPTLSASLRLVLVTADTNGPFLRNVMIELLVSHARSTQAVRPLAHREALIQRMLP